MLLSTSNDQKLRTKQIRESREEQCVFFCLGGGLLLFAFIFCSSLLLQHTFDISFWSDLFFFFFSLDCFVLLSPLWIFSIDHRKSTVLEDSYQPLFLSLAYSFSTLSFD